MPDVPVIDLRESDEKIVPTLRAACTDVGFFYVVGHGPRLCARARVCGRLWGCRCLVHGASSMQPGCCMHALRPREVCASVRASRGKGSLQPTPTSLLHALLRLARSPGVPDGDFATLYADMQRFFALDAASKMKVCTTTNPHNRGWTPLGEETLDPARQTCGDTKEGYYIGRDVQSGHPCADLPLHGPNVWPDEASLPGWRQNMEKYHASMERVGRRLTSLLALTLGLKVLPASERPHGTREQMRAATDRGPLPPPPRPARTHTYTRTHT
jgi:hypothetical protein